MAPITSEQRKAIHRLWQRDNDGADSYRTFRARFRHCFGGYIGGMWCLMFVGIEPDGYTHT